MLSVIIRMGVINVNILIIEDEIQLAESLARLFEKKHFIVQVALDGQVGLDYALSTHFDVIILDVMLPKLNGFDLIQKLRSAGISTPVLFLTAKSTLSDELQGLNLGADDYLTKPFSFEKLFTRIKVLLRRGQLVPSEILTFDDLELNMATCILSQGVHEIVLSAKEFHLMSLLMKKTGIFISKEEIMEKIWGYDAENEYNTVEVYISFLRRKINALNSMVTIKVNRNIGYRLEVKS